MIDQRNIKSSSGISEKRFAIKTQLQIGAQYKEIELTLTNRDAMGYRMLLGREAMDETNLINPNSSFLFGKIDDSHINKIYGKNKQIKHGLSIGLLASNPNLYSNKRILEATKERGHEVHFLNIKECYMKLDVI